MSYETAPQESDYSSWAVGWAGFAGFMLILIGIMDVIQGLVAVVNDEFYVVGQEWVFEFDVTAWGWIHLILGVVLIASGVGIFSGNVAARTVGVIVAGLGAIDFPAVFRAIKQSGYGHDMSLELYPYTDRPEEAGRQSLDHLLPLLEEAGLTE